MKLRTYIFRIFFLPVFALSIVGATSVYAIPTNPVDIAVQNATSKLLQESIGSTFLGSRALESVGAGVQSTTAAAFGVPISSGGIPLVDPDDPAGKATNAILDLTNTTIVKNPELMTRITDAARASIGIPVPTRVYTTEPVPGANCRCVDDADKCTKVETRKYVCTIEGSGVSGFQNIFGSIVNYVVNITLILCVLALVVMGILWSLSGSDDERTKKVKTWFVNIIIGFIILVFFRYILKFLAPWIFQ